MTPLHLTNARLIDPEALTEVSGDLPIEVGRIAGLGREARRGTSVFDCRGLRLAPDLTDFSVKIVGRIHA
jgi:dihydroorotase